MIKLTKITNAITKVTGRTGLKVSKYSPEILIVTGVVGIITSTVLACRGTLKLEAILDESHATLLKINTANDDGTVSLETYSKADANKDIFTTYCQTGYKIAKIYAPAISVGLLSITCILSSYKILKGRNVALMAAYNGVAGAFAKYRERLIADVGGDKDKEYLYGVKKQEIVEAAYTDEDGKKHKEVKKTISVVDGSQYAQRFDENSHQWMPTLAYNIEFLKCTQNIANDVLHAKGHIFLNEVYDMLGLKRTTDGAITGWVRGKGDDYVDFNIFSSAVCMKPNQFDSFERCILLDFNVAGVIYDLI